MICPVCNKEFEIKNSLVNKSDNHFCSMSCSAIYNSNLRAKERKTGEYVKCYICGKEHYRPRHLLYDSGIHFCSKECTNIYKASDEMKGENNPKYDRIEVECSNCSKKLFRTKTQVERNKDNHYCSRECMAEHYIGLVYGENHPSWKGGRNGIYYGHDWGRISDSIIERDNHTCQRCNAKKEELPKHWCLQVHHIKPLRECEDLEEANNPKNLITLCNRCHGIVEHHGIDFEIKV